MEAPFKEFQMPYFFKSFHVLFSENSYFVSHQAVNLNDFELAVVNYRFVN